MRLLEEAERIYAVLGTIPLDIAMQLMEQGFIVERLEEQWERKYF